MDIRCASIAPRGGLGTVCLWQTNNVGPVLLAQSNSDSYDGLRVLVSSSVMRIKALDTWSPRSS